MVWRVTELEVNGFFLWTAVSGGVTSVADHRIAAGPGPSGTVTLSFHLSGLLAPIFGRLASGLTRRYINMEAEGLKRRSEAGTLVPAACAQ